MIPKQKRGSLAGRTLRRGRLRTPVTMESEDAPETSSETAQTDEVTPFARETTKYTPQSRWETRRRKGRRLKRASAMLVRPPDMASSLARISKDISRKAACWETARLGGYGCMRSPDIWKARRLSSSGCRGYNICFGTAVGNPASQSQRLRRTCAKLVRPPGIFASARRKGTRFASAAHRA